MRNWLAGVAFMAGLLLAAPDGQVLAQDRVTLGWGRILTNDSLGDGKDRWRTGSYSISLLRGPAWQGHLPGSPGEILEFRARAEVIAPETLTFMRPGDRRYAGVLSFGLHTHFETAGWESSIGADLVITGPQTGMSDLQAAIHEVLNYPEPLVAADQIADGFHPTLVAELGRNLDLGTDGTLHLRPFVEAQAGVETFLRVGADLTIGAWGKGALMLREPVSGQRYRGIKGSPSPGFSLTLGADVARVFDSAFLPEGGAAGLSDIRKRLRAGLAWQGERSAVFYGLTWLGREFDSQRTDHQLVGSLSLSLRF